jgi:hypothetical protein
MINMNFPLLPAKYLLDAYHIPSYFCLFLLFLLLLDVADGHEGDADGGYDEYEEEAHSSHDHGAVDEDVALQEELVAQVADW